MGSKSLSNKKRRDFLRGIANVACGVGISAMGIGWLANKASAMPPQAIRPPGALDEDGFLSRCVRCGLCVRDCPYDILSLADLDSDVPVGTPYFTARTGPCEMCDDIPCVVACPTGALDRRLVDINKARMGLAVLIDQEECIAFQGLRCEVCFNVCPLQDKAISLEYRHNDRTGKHALLIPIVDSQHCTGCGLCEKACIMEEATIKVLPAHIAKGRLGEHYRLGWKQKQKAGKSLVTPDAEHKFNLPEGVKYDYDNSELHYEKGSALDTLNRRRGKQ
ncbi:MAG: ferredoxin-type protein NapG [Thiotrichaceae bacterium]|nr:ferredoxin-type protein NapG [Thiotrichaceae bacterium]